MDAVLSNIMDFLTRYPTEVVFLLALLMGFIGLFYYFFRFNRDVFNAQSIVIVVFVFLLFAQVILYFWLNNSLISISVFGVWFIGLAVSLGILPGIKDRDFTFTGRRLYRKRVGGRLRNR